MRARREMPIETYAAEQLSQRRKRIRRRGAKISDLTPEQLHRLRIQVKKARYATEFFSGLYQGKKSAKRCKKIRSSLTQLQNCLGRINDIVTHKALFADIIASPCKRFDGGAKPPPRICCGSHHWGSAGAASATCLIARARRIPASIAPRHSGSCRAGSARRQRQHRRRNTRPEPAALEW